MFSGVGGFELGIQKAIPSAECIGFSEIDKWAISIYQNHFKDHKNYGDANKINPSEIPDFDVLVGGFPCQAFSIAGNRKGFDDTRGTLFFEIARILESKRPGLFVLENVKGLLSHNKGATFKTIINSLDELGYDVQWQVLNSKDFGVPQNRQRVFIVGHLRASGRSTRQIFSIRLGHSKTTGISGQVSADGLCPTLTTNKGEGLKVLQLNQTNLKSNNGTQPYYQDRVYNPFGLSPALNRFVEPKVVCFNAERGTRDKDPNPKRGGGSGMLSRDDGLSYAITASSANHPIQLIGGSQGNRVYDPMGIAVTQSALGGGRGAGTGLYCIDNCCIRKLMPIECERLQGFPDNWTQYGVDGEEISDTQRYKCCGNAVTVNVVVAIFNELKGY